MKPLAIAALTLALVTPVEANDMHLVPKINAALRKWVKPIGCDNGTPTLSTYYGPGFYGRKTASGKVFHAGSLGVAHRTLPFGTNLLITNPRTGKSITVPVDDRGPYSIATLDLSRGAAVAIGMNTSMYLCVTGITQTMEAKSHERPNSRKYRTRRHDTAGYSPVYRPDGATP